MGYATTNSVVRQIELLYDGGSATGLSDRQLLERFNAGRDSSPKRPSAHLSPGTARK